MNILEPRFRYVDSDATDLRKAFARLRGESSRVAGSATPKVAAPVTHVVTLERARKSTS